jgi:PAS domain S-box-containing protein
VIDFNDKPALLLHARDITDRLKYQETLRQMNLKLEEKVKQRTEELENLNATLHKEISFRKEAEIAIEQQKDFLRMLIDMNPNMIFVKDKEGELVLVNEAFAKFHHSTSAEMIGRKQSSFIHKDNTERIKHLLDADQTVINEKKTVSFSGIKLYHHDGSGDSIFVQMIKTPIKSLTDDTTNILGIMTDITEIKTAEEKLKQSEQLYRQIARNVPNSAILIFDH